MMNQDVHGYSQTYDQIGFYWTYQTYKHTIMKNLSLGGTTRNVTAQIFETHPTSRQHRIHIKKKFHSKIFIKSYPSHVELKNLIKFIKKCVLMWKMNAQGKNLKNVARGIFLIRNTKGIYYLEIFLQC